MAVTYKDIALIVERGIEDIDTPRRFLAYLKTREGKQLTKRDLPALETIEPLACYRSIAGMVYLNWGGYGLAEAYRKEATASPGSILLAYTTGAPTVDATWIEEKNAHCFSAAVKRNERRRKALADVSALKACARAVNTINEANAALAALVEYDAPLYEERCEIEKLVGAR